MKASTVSYFIDMGEFTIVAEESMLHLVECRHCKPLWKKCLAFCSNVLEAPNRAYHPRAIIFNQENYDTMLQEFEAIMQAVGDGRKKDADSKEVSSADRGDMEDMR